MEVIDRRSALRIGAAAALSSAFPALAACSRKEEPAPVPEPGQTPVSEPEPTPPSTEPEPVHYTIDNIRQYIVGVDEEVELPADGDEPGEKIVPICFDNAATTPAFVPVRDEVNRSLLTYGAVHRGYSQKATITDGIYEDTRKKVLEFVGVNPEDGVYTCFYTQNTTDGLNKLADALIESPDDVVLTTRMEHHANLLTWRNRCKVVIAECDELGRIDYEEIERKLTENPAVKYVSITAASNVTGYVTDVHRVAKMAHAHGAKIIVDGAQIVAHRAFSMLGETPEEDIDFFAFSAHKMYAPYGGGAVVARLEELRAHMPRYVGGGIVLVVGEDWVNYKQPPALYEAGSPNFPGVVALGKSIDVLREVGFDAIQAHEQALLHRLIDGMKKIDGMIIYGDSDNIADKTGVVTFKAAGVNTGVLARTLENPYGIATRRGAFCAHPYVWSILHLSDDRVRDFADCDSINTAGMIRLSFGIYNTEDEVDRFLELLPGAIEEAREAQEWYAYANPDF